LDDRHGAQGTLDTASKASLENEFNTKSEDEALKIILEKGKVETGGVCLSSLLTTFLQLADRFLQETGRDGDRNSSQGGRQAH